MQEFQENEQILGRTECSGKELMNTITRVSFSGNRKKHRVSKTLLKIEERKTGSCVTRDRKERKST